jgi:calcineurin-like phosphoesterase
MRILLIGDIVGKPGRQIVCQALGPLIEREGLDFVIANGENAAGGTGITPAIYRELIGAGVNVITLGDHIYKRGEIIGVLQTEQNIVKPANYPSDAPGREFAVATGRNGTHVAVMSLLGRVFMRPVDCPFKAAEAASRRARFGGTGNPYSRAYSG